MKPEERSEHLLSITRSKAKMYEYDVPEAHHIDIPRDPANLFPLSIGLLGDLASRTNSRDISGEHGGKLRETLRFSAQFFDSFSQSRLQEDLDPYVLLLGAASYYLRDLPGSSFVLANRLKDTCPDLDCSGLEVLLLWLLRGDFSECHAEPNGPYAESIDGITQSLAQFFESGSGHDRFTEMSSNLRRDAYRLGTPRQLLLADVICAIVRRRFENSTWHSLPQYSDLSLADWQHVLEKETFVRELWPGQHLLGQCGVFRGKSAIVQMPTSAGKTKATEMIMRSSFLAGRTSLAVIVAPFRALCHEIRNDLVEAFRDEPINVNALSDVPQVDFKIANLSEQQVLVVTPEKLMHVLRHKPDLARHVGLLIYDEGHQFDSGTRGITFELLVTSLKIMIPREAQTVLISAVIKNAAKIGSWLNGKDSQVISRTHLIPTYRSVAFTNWRHIRGRLEFVSQDDPETGEFFVPRIIDRQLLQNRGRESKVRWFPERSDGGAIALYLGLKVVSKGSVAIFCGRKLSTTKLCNTVVDAYSRGLSLAKPIEHSDKDEIGRLHFLHERNLGSETTTTRSASLGVFAHHGNIPQGIRLAVEHAMKEGLARFVICTSTLAQGVNLPIRYLIVASVYQGQHRIKVRDFHNLIGRAGRSGMYTEGSILFADPAIFDGRKANDWRWQQVKELLEPDMAEPCISTLGSIFDPLHSDDQRYRIRMEPLDFAKAYVEDEVDMLIRAIASQEQAKKFSLAGLGDQVALKMRLISAVENYLMAHWIDNSDEPEGNYVDELAMETLAYFLAEDSQQDEIVGLFRLLAENIAQKVPEAQRRNAFGKTLYGVQNCLDVEEWVKHHLDTLVLCGGSDELLAALWPLIARNVQNNTFKRCTPKSLLQDLALRWLQGEPFAALLNLLGTEGARIGTGRRPRYPTIDHVVDICENALSYHGTLLVGAVVELVEIVRFEGKEDLIRLLQALQKQLKYGLPSSSAITFYELGFADRIVSMELGSTIAAEVSNREEIDSGIRENEQAIREILEKYPRYFTRVLDELL